MPNDRGKAGDASSVVSTLEPPHRFFRSRKWRSRLPLTHCENCGAQLSGHWCGQCGQPAIDYRRSLRHVIVELLNEFLNWDSKFFGTIGFLVAKPWRLTNEFVSGKRVRHVHPLRLYLLGSILFFFAVNYWAKAIHVDTPRLGPADRATIEAELQKQNLAPEVREEVNRALAGHTIGPKAATESPDHVAADGKDAPRSIQSSADENSETPLGQWLEARARQKMGERGTKMELFVRTLISNLPYMMLCCVPLFALVLKILYVRRGIFYIDHLVYALHIHTFAYVGIILIVLTTMALTRLASGLLTGWIVALLWCAFAAQIFLSIRRVYRQSWFTTVLKFFIGGFVYLMVLGFALAATFFITLALPTS
jgi:Protein of unknown function (DUF3667)